MKITEKQLRKYIRKMVKENLANFGDKKATSFGKDKEDKKEEEPKEKLEEAMDAGIHARLSPEENQQLATWLDAGGDLELPEDLEMKLYDYYADEMPYGVQKGREGDPQEWLFNKLAETRTNFQEESCGGLHEEEFTESDDSIFDRVGNRFDMLNRFQGAVGLSDEEMLDELVRQMSEDEAEQAFDYIARMHDLSLTLRDEIPRMDKFRAMSAILEEMGGESWELLDAIVRQMSDQEAEEAFEYMSRMHDVPFPKDMEEAFVQEDQELTPEFFKEEDESSEDTVSEASDGSNDVESWEDSKPAPGPRDLEKDLSLDENDSPIKEAGKAKETEHSGAKKGKGAYWGKKKQAKDESKKVRRQQDKKETQTLDESGYQSCACRDCMEIAIGEEGAYCEDCLQAGCPESLSGECEAPGAYGGDMRENICPSWISS
jgi:hypothetical protein